jgi:hypothetical protein
MLGGDHSPFGWAVQYLDAPMDVVLNAVLSAHEGWGHTVRVAAPVPYPSVLRALAPFEAPWTRELVMPCGQWTAYLNNGLNGGDPTAYGPVISERLNVRLVMAANTPRYGPGHQATQLWVSGPLGNPPLLDERTLSASATDGRWEWHASGRPFAFEDLARYQARRISDRLDRSLLLHYLDELGVPAGDETSYGSGVLIQQSVDWPTRKVSVEETLADVRA